jgi:Mrp family chromosome partitioning ATPase
MKYDFILFDTPPVHSINDAKIIGAFCDVTLYVVRYNLTSKSLLPFVQKLKVKKSLPDMNIVFNGLEQGRDGEGYKYENYYNSQAKKG